MNILSIIPEFSLPKLCESFSPCTIAIKCHLIYVVRFLPLSQSEIYFCGFSALKMTVNLMTFFYLYFCCFRILISICSSLIYYFLRGFRLRWLLLGCTFTSIWLCVLTTKAENCYLTRILPTHGICFSWEFSSIYF